MSFETALRADRERILDALKKLEGTGAGQPELREEILYKLYAEVLAHNWAKERVLYPFLIDDEKGHRLAIELRNEARGAELLLEELHQMPKTDSLFSHKVRVLDGALRQHFDHDLESLLPVLGEHIPKGEELLVLERMDAKRQRARREVHARS